MQFLRSGLDREIGLIFFCPDPDCPSLAICLKAVIFTARCYASAVLAMGLCLSVSVSVCLSVCLSQVRVLLKRLNVGSHKQHHTIA